LTLPDARIDIIEHAASKSDNGRYDKAEHSGAVARDLAQEDGPSNTKLHLR